MRHLFVLSFVLLVWPLASRPLVAGETALRFRELGHQLNESEVERALWQAVAEDDERWPEENKQRTVLYLKLPKTGSSTVKRIFERFGVSRDLNIMWSDPDWHIHARELPPNETYNMLFDHVIFDPTWMGPYFPGGKYVTFVRDPVNRTISQYYFRYKLDKVLWIDDDCHWCQWRLDLREENRSVTLLPEWLQACVCAHNVQARYLGHDLAWNLQTLDFVGVTELLHESLLMMRRVLSWSLLDLMYYSLKVNTNNRPSPEDFPPEVIAEIESFNRADRLLYDSYRQLLINQINAVPPVEFALELEIFGRLRDMCSWTNSDKEVHKCVDELRKRAPEELARLDS